MVQMCPVVQHDLGNRICEVASFVARYRIFYQCRGAMFLCNDEHTRESSAVRSSADECDLQRRLELHVLREPNKNSGLQKRRVQRRQSVVVVTGVACEVLANELVVTRIGNCIKQIRCDYISERCRIRQVVAQETIHDYKMSAGSFGIRETARVNTGEFVCAGYGYKILFRQRGQIRVLPLFFSDRRKAQRPEAVHGAATPQLETRRRR